MRGERHALPILTAAVVLALLSVACSEDPEVRTLTDMVLTPDPPFDLPRVSADGPVHSRRKILQLTVHIQLHPNGRVSAGHLGKAYSLDELGKHCYHIAGTSRDLSKPSKPSKVWAIIRSDRRVPWGTMREVLLQLSDWSVRIDHVLFGVASPDGERARFATLHMAPAELDWPWSPWDEKPAHRVEVVQSAGGSSAAAHLSAALPGDLAGPDLSKPVVIDAEDTVPTEAVLQIADVLFRHGAQGVIFRRIGEPYVGPSPSEPPGIEIRLNGVEVPAGETEVPTREADWRIALR